jgi:hypothetical protein
MVEGDKGCDLRVREGTAKCFLARVEGDMVAQRVTPAELARCVGCTRTWIMQILMGVRDMPADTMVIIASHLSIELEITMPPRG